MHSALTLGVATARVQRRLAGVTPCLLQIIDGRLPTGSTIKFRSQ